MKIRTFLKGFSTLNLIFLFLGCIILGVTIKGGLFTLLKPAHDYDYVLENGLKEGMHIKGDICYSLGSFASQSTYTQYETYRTGSKTSGYYYVIPAGEVGFAAVYVRKGDKSAMDKLTDETYDYLDGGADTQAVLHFNGRVVKMEKHLKGLESAFKKQMKEWGYTDADIEELLKDTDGKCLVLEGPADVTTAYAFGSVGLILLALGIFFYIRRYKKEKAWEATREEEWTQV